MRYEYHDVPTDDNLDDAARLALEDILRSGSEQAKLQAAHQVRQDFIKKDAGPPIALIANPEALTALVSSWKNAALPPMTPILAPAEDCVTTLVTPE